MLVLSGGSGVFNTPPESRMLDLTGRLRCVRRHRVWRTMAQLCKVHELCYYIANGAGKVMAANLHPGSIVYHLTLACQFPCVNVYVKCC